LHLFLDLICNLGVDLRGGGLNRVTSQYPAEIQVYAQRPRIGFPNTCQLEFPARFILIKSLGWLSDLKIYCPAKRGVCRGRLGAPSGGSFMPSV
jgi:hypothetical protein